MHNIDLRDMAGRLKARDAAMQEAARKSEAEDASRQEVICGLEASHRAGRRRREQRREVVGKVHRRGADKGVRGKGAGGATGVGVIFLEPASHD